MKLIANPSRDSWSDILKRPTLDKLDLDAIVQDVFDAVKSKGDKAVIEYTKKFDKASLPNISVSESEISEGVSLVSDELKEAIQLAKKNIETFHASQKIEKQLVETAPGVQCWQESRGIEKVGIYIPGGSAPLFSTVLMLAVPAKLGGCKEIVLCSPPNKEGKLHPAILYAAQLCGVTNIFKVGGIQAIGAMTFGTESVPNVFKIFGPGNQYVTAAKQVALSEGVSIDMPAGPSELLVLADETANAAFVASDLLSQAEHGKDSQVILVSTSMDLIKDVEAEISNQLKELPRKDIAEVAIKHSKSILVKDNVEALDLINTYGPEHFIVCTKDNDFFVNGIQNAGSVFIGNYTPESAGDYASGTNHTLPTNGFSKAYSGMNLDSFLKSMTFQEISEKGIQNIGGAIEEMAAAEGLQAHKNAVTLRLESLNK